MIRITGGLFRGRKINAPGGQGIRPTTALVRESLFSQLQFILPGCRFLDLFAGCGTVSVEALSRGAAQVVSVENHPRHYAFILKNRALFKLSEAQAQVLHQSALTYVKMRCFQPFDVIFADPPYGYPDWESLLTLIFQNGWLAPSGVIVLEQAKSDETPIGFERRLFGDTALSVRFASELSPEEASVSQAAPADFPPLKPDPSFG